jgi:excisionase family DNA binding protein
VKQVAERLEISPSLVYRLVEQGILPHRRIGAKGRRGIIRITMEDIERFLKSVKIDTE